MTTQKTLDNILTSIIKENMQLLLERDFEALSTKLEVVKAMESEVVKRSVVRPKKNVEVLLLTPKEEDIAKASPNKAKVRGRYTNWFLPSLWGPIHVVIK